jgi:hypothetical protein
LRDAEAGWIVVVFANRGVIITGGLMIIRGADRSMAGRFVA